MLYIGTRRVVTAVLLTAMTGLFAFFGVMFSLTSNEKKENDEERLRLSAIPPESAESVDVSGFVLNILCSKSSKDLLYGESASDNLVFRGATMRNAHLESETGVEISVTSGDNFYRIAKDDILSGAHQYDLYAASVSDGLARLLAEGTLHDFSSSEYIDLENEWYDRKTTDSLSVFGKKYLLSSDISDARWWSYAISYDNTTDAASLDGAAKDGELTLEAMLASGNILADEGDMYPLWFGLGGSFVTSDSDGLHFTSLADFRAEIEQLSLLRRQSGEKDFRYSLVTLYELYGADKAGLLPLPKRESEADYGGYIDLDSAILLAIPSGSRDKYNTEYVVDRMAALSAEYVSPYFAESFSGDTEIYDIIIENSACDLTSLFGYGDMEELVASLAESDSRLALEYYNRKELYTKALGIIEKRLAKTE